MLRWASSYEETVKSRGFSLLGDIVSDDEPTSISRRLVDKAGTTCAGLHLNKSRPNSCVLVLESYTRDSHFMTFRSGELPQLAHPPFSRRQWVGDNVPLDDVIIRHRAFVASDDHANALCTIKDINELLTLMKRSAELSRDWRFGQPADQLLEADLRGGLGKHYDRLGKKFFQQLAAELPAARAIGSE
jgi:hypothetical protein